MRESEWSDAKVIAASLHNPELFGLIFERHHRSVFKFAVRRIGPNEGPDVAAEVFNRAFSRRHRYDQTKPNSLPWLYGIAANIVGDRLRRSARRPRLFVAAASLVDDDLTTDADNRVVAEQLGDRLNQALAKLSMRDRETLLLYALEGLTYSEIGRALGIPAGTVGSRLNRARAKILESVPDLRQITGWEAPPRTGGHR